MNDTDTAAILDGFAEAFPGAVVSLSVAIDGTKTALASGMRPHSATSRHLFQGGPGQRGTASIVCKTTGWTDQDGNAYAPDFEDVLPGLPVTIGGKTYRILMASVTPDGGLVRLALDAPDMVGQ